MSVKPKSISNLAEYWDELTPVQQQFMIQRVKGLAGYNKIKMQHPEMKLADIKDFMVQPNELQ